MDFICNMLVLKVVVIWNGKCCMLEGDNLVLGDIVLLEVGDKVFVDLCLLCSYGLVI